YFDWAGCVVLPRSNHANANNARDEIARMFACIHVAHLVLGTCEAFENLFRERTREQIDVFLRGGKAKLDAIELNRLRTFTLAVIDLTDLGRITAAAEDQEYFKCFDGRAGISSR